MFSASMRSTVRYRTVDLVTMATLGVAFGVVFWAWGKLYGVLDLAAAIGYAPAGALMGGGWLIAGVIGGLVIGRPGAAFGTELIAACISMFVLGGTEWGFTVLLSGIAQGIGAELAFAVVAYRLFRLPIAVLSGVLAGLGGAVYEVYYYYADWSLTHQLVHVGFFMVSGAVIAGGVGWALVRSLAHAGVLDAFRAGRAVGGV